MQLEMVDPFVEASQDVIRNWWPDGPLGSEIGLMDPGTKLDGVCVRVAFARKPDSAVLVQMDHDVARKVAARMTGEALADGLDEYSQSALGELGNVLSGLAVTKLNHVNIDLDIDPPVLLGAQDGRAGVTLNKEALFISIDTADGRLRVIVYADEVAEAS